MTYPHAAFAPDMYLSAGKLLVEHRYQILIIVLAVLTIAEIYKPAKVPPGTRWQNRGHNLLIGAMYILAGSLLGLGMTWIAIKTETLDIGLFSVLPTPLWAKIVVGFILFDFIEYWRHRLSHAVPTLWRVHRVHHSDPLMDVSTAFRNHPLNWMTIYPPRAIAIILFGIPPITLAIYTLVWFVTVSYHHSNISLGRRIESLIDLLIVTPDRHYVHHACHDRKQTDSQFGVVFIIWDKIFGTLVSAPSRQVFEHGLEEFPDESDHTLLGMLSQPFKPVNAAPDHSLDIALQGSAEAHRETSSQI